MRKETKAHLSNNIPMDVYYPECCFGSQSNHPILVIPYSNPTSYISPKHSAILFDLKPWLILDYARAAPSITIPTSPSM